MLGFADDGTEDETTVMRRLEILVNHSRFLHHSPADIHSQADQMLASLAGQGVRSESDSDSDEEDVLMPPLERIGDHRTEDWPLPLMFDSDTDAEMPALASVSNSSDSEGADSGEEDEGDESSSEDQDEVSDERIQSVRPFDLEFDPGMEARSENSGMFVRLSSLWRGSVARESNAAETEPSTRSTDVAEDAEGDEGDDEADMPPLEHEPPFVTDGRGRVVWSSSSGSGYPQPESSSSARRASVTIPGAFPPSPPSRTIPTPSPRQPTGEGGFTTDGRGRVIGTTGTREEEEGEGDEAQGRSEAPVQPRSFLGRVLDAFF
jgi:E3 ubiquitin-protein ligase makorin